MSFEDTKGILMCSLYSRRGSQKIDKGIDEWLWAETGAYIQFERYFKKLYGGGTVLGQLTYKSIATQTDPGTQFILDAMQVYFRNWWSRKNMSREGGFRKPDGLAISPGGKTIEIIEVKPYHSYQDGLQQLNEMIGIIKDGLRAYYRENSINKNQSIGPDPDNYITVKASAWKPSEPGLVIPLPFNPRVNEIAWICYKPTLREAGGGGLPADGVILYEIHYIERKQIRQKVPDDVARRLAEAQARQRKAENWSPFVQEYIRANKQDAELIRAIVISVGVVAAVAIVAAAIIYVVPVVAASATVAAVSTEAAVLASEAAVLTAELAPAAPALVRVAIEDQHIIEFVEELSHQAMRAR